FSPWSYKAFASAVLSGPTGVLIEGAQATNHNKTDTTNIWNNGTMEYRNIGSFLYRIEKNDIL
ncbi:MAG: hypothetical protein LJE66_10060, partial [Desulfobacterales bacterium]|nr:hypothetical protein [Desulfobacterales bacterium]